MKNINTVLVIIIIILSSLLSYIAGKGMLTFNNPLASFPPTLPSPSPSENPACTLEAKICPDGSSVGRIPPSCDFAPCKTPTSSSQTISGGGKLSFPKYEIIIPSNWVYEIESPSPDSETISLKGDNLSIVITQGGFGGSACLYPGDADSEGPSARYTHYIEITTASGDKLRRSWNEPEVGYGLCQLTQYGWGAPTLYGHISLKTANPLSEVEQNTLDTILRSIKKI